MKYIVTVLIALLSLPLMGQQSGSLSRKAEIEKCIEEVYTLKDFKRYADSLTLTIDELCDYPVIFPIKKVKRISSGFGMRIHPISRVRSFHTGIDLPEIKGTPVYATANGVVKQKGYDSGYGYFIELSHASGFRTFYAHLSKTLVNVGDRVSIAQQIACVGNTGVSTGSHLHYEIRKVKRYLNPKEWCYCLFDIFKNKL